MSRNTRITFEANLRGQTVTVEAFLNPPDCNVGIMGWQIEECELFDQLGEPLDWDLTDEELGRLYEAMPDPEDSTPDYPNE